MGLWKPNTSVLLGMAARARGLLSVVPLLSMFSKSTAPSLLTTMDTGTTVNYLIQCDKAWR